ncbi:MAG: cyclase family protein [Sutterellaceae bacterium]|nr:cyclase family protein [Sutterellaceae bacterium]
MDLSRLTHIVDLTHEISDATPPYPGDPQANRDSIYTVADDGFAVDVWRIATHTGTHIDAAAHVLAGVDAAPLSSYPLTHFEGVARVVDAVGEAVSVAAVKTALQSRRKVDWLIVRSGWSKFWDQPDIYFRGKYPILGAGVVELLTKIGLKGIALDMPSPDRYNTGDYLHQKLLGAGFLIVENLADCSVLPANKDLWFSAWPINWASADGAPVRAVVRY